MTVHVGRVVALGEQGPTVRVPMLGGDQPFGPLPSSVTDLAENDQVIVTSVGQAADRLQVLARLQGRRTVTAEVDGLVERLDDGDARDAAQDQRLQVLTERCSDLDARTTSATERNVTQDRRLSDIETINGAQTSRLDAVESKNSTQDQRITAVDEAALHRTGAETKTGVLTLRSEPVIPEPTLGTSPVRSDDTRLSRLFAAYTQAANQSLVNGTTTLAWGTPLITGSLITREASGAGHQFRLGRSGLWLVFCCIRVQSGGNVAYTGLNIVSSAEMHATTPSAVTTNGFLVLTQTVPIVATADDFVAANVYHERGATVSSLASQTMIRVAWLGPIS